MKSSINWSSGLPIYISVSNLAAKEATSQNLLQAVEDTSQIVRHCCRGSYDKGCLDMNWKAVAKLQLSFGWKNASSLQVRLRTFLITHERTAEYDKWELKILHFYDADVLYVSDLFIQLKESSRESQRQLRELKPSNRDVCLQNYFAEHAKRHHHLFHVFSFTIISLSTTFVFIRFMTGIKRLFMTKSLLIYAFNFVT